MFIVRAYQPADAPAISALFYNTIRTVNLGDYTQEQVDAWAGVPTDKSADHWHRRLSALTTFVAVSRDELVGFSDLRDDGYLEHLFVHHRYQRQGIATALHGTVEGEAMRRSLPRLFTEASITARPFFLRMGYQQVKQQIVTRHGVDLTNFVMEKSV